ncbi:MAG: cell division/cell wall cluster transcriptional repressor MraZ [Armatimonadota bacterium]|nr:MAG: cell division/cell wall cluster transcriptional repressor MraZ [Armatimonadota bacterium]
MTSNLWGEYEHQLDDKGRVTVPAAWRPQLAEGLFLCPGLNGNCLFILPKWRWDGIQETLSKVTYDDEKGMALQRLFGSGVETKIDRQGRVFIPPKLRARASISDEVMLCGGFDRIEIWNPDERRLFEEKELNPEALREKARSKRL